MKPWKLRLCKVAPFVAVIFLVGYTCIVATDQAVASPQLNAVILTWLGLVTITAIGTLFWALITDDVDDLRVMVARSRPNPRLRFLPLQPVPDLPAAPVWPVPPPRPAPNTYGTARPVDRIEEELREITRDIKPRPDDPRDMAS